MSKLIRFTVEEQRKIRLMLFTETKIKHPEIEWEQWEEESYLNIPSNKMKTNVSQLVQGESLIAVLN